MSRNLLSRGQIPYLKKLELEMILLSRFPSDAFISYSTGITKDLDHGCEIWYDARLCPEVDQSLIESIGRDSGFKIFLVANNELPLPLQRKKTRWF